MYLFFDFCKGILLARFRANIAEFWCIIDIKMECDSRSRESCHDFGLDGFRDIMCFSEENIFVREDNMCFDECVISGSASF